MKVLVTGATGFLGRAEREIGYLPRTLAEGLRETIRWLRDTGPAPASAMGASPGP